MMYPHEFPHEKSPQNPEWIVFQALKKLSTTDFDVFYSRTFSKIGDGKNIEFEVDFIIADLRNNWFNGLVCLEVKGGQLVQKNDETWLQNGKPIDSPVKQVTSAMHNLVDLYPRVAKDVPFGWKICFPHTIIPATGNLPTNIDPIQLIDHEKLQNPAKYISGYFDELENGHPNRKGISINEYNFFIEPWIKDYGFVLPLSAKMDSDEKQFIKLTNDQMSVLRAASENDRIRVKGVAGSGKTVIAKEIAAENVKQGKDVLFLCYNKTLASNVNSYIARYKQKNNQTNNTAFSAETYHSFAASEITRIEKQWWKENQQDEDFWDFMVPEKLLDVRGQLDSPDLYDVIIIDEGQDFMEDWYESILGFLKEEGKFYVFMDDFQNINQTCASIPNVHSYIKLTLNENCRNTKHITDKMNEIINMEDFRIESKEGVPEGEPVKVVKFINDTDQQTKLLGEIRRLVDKENVSPDKILILLNTDKENSCLANTQMIGRYDLKQLRASGILNNYSISYTHIKTFKGLEADIVFIVDTDKVTYDPFLLYTQVSRAKHRLYIFEKEE